VVRNAEHTGKNFHSRVNYDDRSLIQATPRSTHHAAGAGLQPAGTTAALVHIGAGGASRHGAGLEDDTTGLARSWDPVGSQAREGEHGPATCCAEVHCLEPSRSVQPGMVAV
jgi:hypothetical protein